MSTEVQTAVAPLQTRSRLRTGLAWLVIFAIVFLVVRAGRRAAAVQDQEQPLFAEQTRMLGMLGLQMNSFQTNSGSSALIHDRMDVLIRQLEASTRTSEGKLRLSILAAENVGTDAALKRLQELEDSDHSPEIATDIQTLRVIYNDGPDRVEPQLRERFDRRYGYLGGLALAYGVAPDKEPRKSLADQAFWFMVRATIVVLILGAVFVFSLALFIAGCVWFFKGKIQAAGIPDTSSVQVFLEAFALYLLLFVFGGRLIRLAGGGSVQWTWMTLPILPLVFAWISMRMSKQQLREAVGWHRGRGFIREFGVGIGGYLAGLPIIAVGCFVTYVLIRITGIENQAASPLLEELKGGPFALLGAYGLACIFAPFMEETMFRGILFHHLRQRWPWLISAPIVSIIFAIIHPQGWVAVPALAATAMVLAGLREWRGSLIAPMAAHACHNFLAVTLAVLLLK